MPRSWVKNGVYKGQNEQNKGPTKPNIKTIELLFLFASLICLECLGPVCQSLIK